MENHRPLFKKVLRGFSVSVVLKVARLLINLVLVAFLARGIGQVGFGHLAVTMALVSVLLCLVELGMQGIMQRELVHEEGQWITVGSVFFSRLMMGALCYVGLMIYALCAPREEGPLLMIYGSLLLTHGTTVFMGWLTARHHLEQVAWAQFTAFLASAAAIALGLMLRMPLWYFAATYVLECWVLMVLSMMMFRRCGGHFSSWRWSVSRSVGLLRESWFELASQMALLLLFRLDTLMVQALRGAADAGIYGAAVRVSEVVYFLPGTLGTACLSALVTLRRRDPLRYQRRVAEYFALTLVAATACAVVLVLAAPPLVAVLFGRDFSACAPILTIHAWAFIPYAIGIARTIYFTAEGRLWVNLPSVFSAVLLNALLNWLWIPAYGGVGAAWATLIAYSVAWVLSSFVLPAGRDVPRLMWAGLKTLPSLASKSLEMRAAFTTGRD